MSRAISVLTEPPDRQLVTMAELAFLKPLIMEPLLEIMEDELQDDMVRQKVDEVSRYLYSNGDMTINSYKFLMDLFTHPTLWWVVILYGLAALFFGRIREGTIVDDWVKFFETKAGGGTESRIQAEEPAVVKQLQIELLQEQVKIIFFFKYRNCLLKR